MKVYLKKSKSYVYLRYLDDEYLSEDCIAGLSFQECIELDNTYRLENYQGDFSFSIDNYLHLNYKHIPIASFYYESFENLGVSYCVEKILKQESDFLDKISFQYKEKDLRNKLLEFYQCIVWDVRRSKKWFYTKFFDKNGIRLREKFIHELRHNPMLYLFNKKGILKCTYAGEILEYQDLYLCNHFKTLMKDKLVKKDVSWYNEKYQVVNYKGNLSLIGDNAFISLLYCGSSFAWVQSKKNETDQDIRKRLYKKMLLGITFSAQDLMVDAEKLKIDILEYNRYINNE